MSEESYPAEVFIPERFLTHLSREILQRVGHHGWGVVIPAQKLGQEIRGGRVHPSILPDNWVGIVNETAIDPNL